MLTSPRHRGIRSTSASTDKPGRCATTSHPDCAASAGSPALRGRPAKTRARRAVASQSSHWTRTRSSTVAARGSLMFPQHGARSRGERQSDDFLRQSESCVQRGATVGLPSPWKKVGTRERTRPPVSTAGCPSAAAPLPNQGAGAGARTTCAASRRPPAGAERVVDQAWRSRILEADVRLPVDGSTPPSTKTGRSCPRPTTTAPSRATAAATAPPDALGGGRKDLRHRAPIAAGTRATAPAGGLEACGRHPSQWKQGLV